MCVNCDNVCVCRRYVCRGVFMYSDTNLFNTSGVVAT